MKPKIVRYLMFSIAAGLMLAAMTACGGGGGGEEPAPDPTPNLRATIDAQLAALPEPTNTPEPTAEPTATPVPTPTPVPTATPMPTPNIQATIDAAFAQTRAAMPPTPTPVPPTATPEPTHTPEPTAAPTPTHTPAPTAPAQSSGPPCIITGKVTIGGNTAPENTVVRASIKKEGDSFSVQAQTNEGGIYALTISRFDEVFDLFVDDGGFKDTGVDTPTTTRGCRVARNLSVS